MTDTSEYPMALPVGAELVGDYVITRTLGAGGFGITYEARERSLDRLVAIKEFFPIDIVEREGWALVKPRSTQFSVKYARGLSRFIDEARTITQFNHPNIVKVLRYFKANNTAFMVLHYEQGVDFDHWQRQLGRRPSESELKSIILPLFDALEMIHKADFLHRDIAPDNIIIRKDGSPVLIDFGSARSDLTFNEKTVSALVKSGYSPFEQYAKTSREQGPWTDIYSFAATLYQAVTQVAPPDSLSRLAHDELVPARKLAGKYYSKPFLDAIDGALAIKILDRPQSVAQWRDLLFPPEPALAEAGAAAPLRVAPAGASNEPAAAAQLINDAVRRAAAFAPSDLAGKMGRLAGRARQGLRELAPRNRGDAAAEADAVSATTPKEAKRQHRSLLSLLDELEHRRAAKDEAEALEKARIDAASAARERAQAERAAEKARVKAERTAAKERANAERAAARERVNAERAAARAAKEAEALARKQKPAQRKWTGLHALPAYFNPSMLVGLALIALMAGIGLFGDKIRDVVEDVELPRLGSAQQPQPQPAPLSAARLIRTLAAHDGGVVFLHLAADGGSLISAGRDGEVKYWQPLTGDLVRKLPLPELPPSAIDNRASVFAFGDDKGFVSLYDAAKQSVASRFPALESRVHALAFVGDEYDFALGGEDGRLQYWAYRDGAYTRQEFRGRDHAGAVTCINSSERFVITGSSDGTAKLWGRARRTLVRTYRGHTGPLNAITVSMDGRRIATASNDETVRIWSSAGARVRRILKGHAGPVLAVAFSPDSRLVATAGRDAAVRLWEARSGRLLARLEGHTGSVRVVQFGADGRHLYSAGDDETIRIWDLEPDATVVN